MTSPSVSDNGPTVEAVNAIAGADTQPDPQPDPQAFLPAEGMTEDQLLDGIMEASRLQQEGQDAAAIALYQTLSAADPEGQYGGMARKALAAMGGREASPADTTPFVDPPLESVDELRLDSAEDGFPDGSGRSDSGHRDDRNEAVQPMAETQTNRLQLMFANWSLGRKQQAALAAASLVSVLGCVGLGWGMNQRFQKQFDNKLIEQQVATDAVPVASPSTAVLAAEMRQVQLDLLVKVAIVALSIVFLQTLIAIALNRASANPLGQLVQAAQEMDPGQMLDIVSTDELGDLALVLNERSSQLEEVFTHLDRSRDHGERLRIEKLEETKAQRQETQRLQQRVMDLLLEIDGARQGNLTVRARVTDDEMGSVADAFNATVANLQELVLRVQAVATQVGQSVATSDQSVGVLANAANQQAQSMAEALTSVEEMSTSIESVAATAAEVASMSRTASAAANSGGEAMNQTVSSINALRGNVAETSKKVKRLTESSQEISKIVALISEVSSKTNLLAFNASIEAVRAGEHGQGFRIVADEVRRLAEQVTGATQEIEQLVTGIQLETAEVLTMMERGTEQVVTGSQLVDETRTTLASLVEMNQEMDDLLQFISSSTASQTATSSVVKDTMQSVATLAHSSSTESEAVSYTLRELVTVSHQLQHSVAQFEAGQSAS